MSVYEPNSRHLREVLIFCFNMKKSAAEAHRMLSNTYGATAISERTCREWFQRFKNGDFLVEDRPNGRRVKVFDDAELEALLGEDSCQSQEKLARLLGVTQQAISKRLRNKTRKTVPSTEHKEGKMKIKGKLPAKTKSKQGKPKKGPASQRRGNAPIRPKKAKLAEAHKLKKMVTRTVNKAMEDELREKALQGKKSLTKKERSAPTSKSQKQTQQ